ncbi:hypothetical protein [Chryseobacterium proteolyticum]|uniref:hypothetical protein n=1 Tax=Chryseobacterium proteolyticum TaxID=118127 RepID=UPI003983D6FD
MSDREKLLQEVLYLIDKYSITAYDIAQGTGISAEGVQKIINGKSKKPLERTLKTITSYITTKYLILENNNKKAEKAITQDATDFNKLPIGEQLEKIYYKESEFEQKLAVIQNSITNNSTVLLAKQDYQDRDFKMLMNKIKAQEEELREIKMMLKEHLKHQSEK